MHDTHFQQLQQLFIDAVEMPEIDREIWLNEQCIGNEEMLGEVKALLLQDQREDDPLEAGLIGIIQDTMQFEESGLEESQNEELPESNLSPEDFLKLVHKIKIMSREDLETWCREHDEFLHSDARRLALELLCEGKLTRYQASVLLTGETATLLIDKYLILDMIHSGRMGIVFKAVHRPMNRVVALKMLPQKLLDSPKKVKRFQREVRVAASLHHPNIVTAYDADESNGAYFFVMEYISGQDLSKLVREQGPMSVPDAVNCLLQVARALNYAHKKNVAHRDIKPRNIMISKKGVIKVLDMGLARIETGGFFGGGADDTTLMDSLIYGNLTAEKSNLTQIGMILGTVGFMAPEQAVNARNADHRSDIYSLGCTFYFLLTSEPPFKADSIFKMIHLHREEEIPSLCSKRSDVPDSVDAVFRKMMAKQPDDRYQSMSHVIDAMQKCEIPDHLSDAQGKRDTTAETSKETFDNETVQLEDYDKDTENIDHEELKKRNRKLWGWFTIFFAVVSLLSVALWLIRSENFIGPGYPITFNN